MNNLIQRLHRISHALKVLVHSLSKQQRVIFVVLSVLLIIGAVGSIAKLSNRITKEVPVAGGNYHEAIVGTPRFINPVLATSTPDQDLVELVYAGLMTFDGTAYIPELAKEYSVSEDGKVYTFILKDKLKFHDGKPLTAYDVAFTVELVQNSSVKSPLRSEWLGVSVEAPNEKTVRFTLENSYAGFLRVATLGILPEHIWGTLTPEQLNFNEHNIQAIGAGPFMITSVNKNKLGIPEKITLKRNSHYSLEKPYLKTISLSFFTTFEDAEKALTRKSVDGLYGVPTSSLVDISGKRAWTIHHSPLSRVFAIFINQNQQELFLDSDVVSALNVVIPREAIIKHVFSGYATAICNPIPPFMTGHSACDTEIMKITQEERETLALSMLEKKGWKKNSLGILEKNGTPFIFTLALPNNPELKETAAMIESAFKNIGITVTLQVFEPGNFDQDVIRPRAYEALLFGQLYEHDSDSFAFWHSSGRNDPGFNIGLYTNSAADSILRNILAEENDVSRQKLYDELAKIWRTNNPAIFLYVPDSIYVVRSSLQNINSNHIINPSERWSTVHTWYRYTDRVWKIFTKN